MEVVIGQKWPVVTLCAIGFANKRDASPLIHHWSAWPPSSRDHFLVDHRLDIGIKGGRGRHEAPFIGRNRFAQVGVDARHGLAILFSHGVPCGTCRGILNRACAGGQHGEIGQGAEDCFIFILVKLPKQLAYWAPVAADARRRSLGGPKPVPIGRPCAHPKKARGYRRFRQLAWRGGWYYPVRQRFAILIIQLRHMTGGTSDQPVAAKARVKEDTLTQGGGVRIVAIAIRRIGSQGGQAADPQGTQGGNFGVTPGGAWPQKIGNGDTDQKHSKADNQRRHKPGSEFHRILSMLRVVGYERRNCCPCRLRQASVLGCGQWLLQHHVEVNVVMLRAACNLKIHHPPTRHVKLQPFHKIVAVAQIARYLRACRQPVPMLRHVPIHGDGGVFHRLTIGCFNVQRPTVDLVYSTAPRLKRR